MLSSSTSSSIRSSSSTSSVSKFKSIFSMQCNRLSSLAFAKSAAVDELVGGASLGVVDENAAVDAADEGAETAVDDDNVFNVLKELLGNPLDNFSSESQSTNSESNSEDKEYPAASEEEEAEEAEVKVVGAATVEFKDAEEEESV